VPAEGARAYALRQLKGGLARSTSQQKERVGGYACCGQDGGKGILGCLEGVGFDQGFFFGRSCAKDMVQVLRAGLEGDLIVGRGRWELRSVLSFKAPND